MTTAILKYAKLTLASMLVLVSMNTNAQNDSGSTLIIADPRLDVLAKKQSQINKLSAFKNSAGQFKGYRVMVLSTNNRDQAYNTRADILRFYPEQTVYMSYQAPYFKLKAGDFLKRDEAEKFRKELSKRFNQSLFIISDIIKLSAEDEAKLLAEKEEKLY